MIPGHPAENPQESAQRHMTIDHKGSQSVLWACKAPANGGGDEILDRKLIAALGPGHDVTRFNVATQSPLNQIRNMLRGMPHPQFKFTNPSIDRAFVETVDRHDRVVISHETLEHLAHCVDRPLTLLIHNVAHDILQQLYGDRLIGRLAARQSLRWERRTYARETIRLVTLSRRDKALVEALAPGRPVAVAYPGLPPLAPLQSGTIIPELVLSGSYDWYPKRRDLIALANDVAASRQTLDWRHDLTLPDHPGAAPITSRSRRIEPADYTQGIRFGLIPDRFLGGFKLKSTYLIANNCILLSRCDLRSEFDGLPHAARFVRYTPALSDILSTMREFADYDQGELHGRWIEFQDACSRRFSWENAAQAITATFA